MGEVLLGFLAVVGGFALAARLSRALVRLGLAAVEATAASGLAEVAARRGDLTGLAERRETEERARQGRLRAALVVVLWLLVLLVPPLTGWMREVYAAASMLWLLPRRTGPRSAP